MAATSEITDVAAQTTRRTWKKDPPDGTNYRYWVSSDGFVIETKPRFLPAYGYEVASLPAAIKPDKFWAVRFDTLALAKLAVQTWTPEQWCRASDERRQAWLRISPNSPALATGEFP